MSEFNLHQWRNKYLFENDLSKGQQKGIREHHNNPNFPGGPAIHDMLDRVAKDWGEDSDLYKTLEDTIVGYPDKYGGITRMGKAEIKSILSNFDVLDDYGWLLEPKQANHTGESTPMREDDNQIRPDLKAAYDQGYKAGYAKCKYEMDGTFPDIFESEDHEVSMAMSSIKEIISNATQLMNKLGQEERNIPGWIQDHITNAENYINQANKGFHELEYGDEENI